jgi:hypothetical protein
MDKDEDFNTLNSEIPNKKEKSETKDKRKTLVIFMIMLIGQTMSIFNTLINNFTIQTYKISYPLLYYGGFFFLFFIVWILINRKITEPKRYYYLIIILETQSFFFDYLANYSYTSQIDSLLNINNDSLNFNINKTYTYQEVSNNGDDKDKKFINSYPAYIYFPIQFVLTFFIFILFMRKKYSLQKKHYFSLFLGIISVILFTCFYIINYFKNSFNLFQNFQTNSKIKVIIYSFLSNVLLSLSYIIQEHFFKSGKEIYEFFPYKAFLSMIILAFESFCVGEFQFINRQIFSNKDIIINFIYFCLINGIYLSIIPFLIKHITSIILVTNYINYLFYYYVIYLSKNNFLEKYGLLLVLGLIFNLLCFCIFVKYKVKKSYHNLKEEVERTSIGSLLNSQKNYDINRSDNTGSAHVEMNLQMTNNPLNNPLENDN